MDSRNQPRLLFIQREHAMGKGLTYVELYALFAVALKKYRRDKKKGTQQVVQEVRLLLSLSIQETDI